MISSIKMPTLLGIFMLYFINITIFCKDCTLNLNVILNIDINI